MSLYCLFCVIWKMKTFSKCSLCIITYFSIFLTAYHWCKKVSQCENSKLFQLTQDISLRIWLLYVTDSLYQCLYSPSKKQRDYACFSCYMWLRFSYCILHTNWYFCIDYTCFFPLDWNMEKEKNTAVSWCLCSAQPQLFQVLLQWNLRHFDSSMVKVLPCSPC